MTYLTWFWVRNWACTAQSLSLSSLRKASDLVCSWPHGKLRAKCLVGEAWGCDSMGVANPVTDHLLLPDFTSMGRRLLITTLVLPLWVFFWPQEPACPCTRQAGSALGLTSLEAALIQGWNGSWCTNGLASEALRELAGVSSASSQSSQRDGAQAAHSDNWLQDVGLSSLSCLTPPLFCSD